MTKSRKRVAWAGAGLTLALTAGTPALADDTELLLSTPNSTGADKPNILFILDSSGSMTTIERSQQPYDKGQIYSGSCASDKLYWTGNSSIPSCGYNSNDIPVSSFVCAQGLVQLAEAGKFTDTMAQYRSTRRSGARWRTLSSSSSNQIECQQDSGKHGATTEVTFMRRLAPTLRLLQTIRTGKSRGAAARLRTPTRFTARTT